MFLQAAPVVQLSPNWRVVNVAPHGVISGTRPILSSADNYSLFAFYQPENEGLWILSIFFYPLGNGNHLVDDNLFQAVWSANRNYLVEENAFVSQSDGNVVLRDNGTSVVWSTNVQRAFL